MTGEGKHGFVRSVRRFFRSVRRFFRLPREMPRHPSPVVPMLRVWLFGLAVGALLAAFTWDEGDASPALMAIPAWLAMLDDVIEGVRHRWPALAAGSLVSWGFVRSEVALSGPGHSLWGEFGVFACATALALATFTGVTRLPQHRHP
ncbi:hypothetical protein O1Q96_33965 [Streptomyces sp. Qhu-G9]|uniref:hypothetical protein n=1 Tax=Streptomyces sp. Qhu-G9 TaxID=3452799 RepID=UPI0022AC405F|nr:hypothetical protein [Streptomyces aurantiacus]WAU84254.1 hypothetical protein O1Q96_33965 [Streptomyces aurantiacus]